MIVPFAESLIVEENRKRNVCEDTVYIVSAHGMEKNDTQIGTAIVHWEREVSGSGHFPSWDREPHSDKGEGLAVLQGKTFLYRHHEEEHTQASPEPYISVYMMQGAGRQLRKDALLPSMHRVDSLLSGIDELRQQ